MPFLSGKQAFLQILKQEGVDTMFGNPGTTELPLMDGLVREPSIRYILALQEAVAISMADGYAQASGKLGVVNVHTSPGLGNAMGMLYNAHREAWPTLKPMVIFVTTIIVVAGWLIVEVFVFSRLRIGIYDTEYSPPGKGVLEP